MSDPLAEMFRAFLADAVRVYYRERRPTREAVARALWECRREPRCVTVTWENLIPGEWGHGWAYKQADALLALFDRVWEAPRG